MNGLYNKIAQGDSVASKISFQFIQVYGVRPAGNRLLNSSKGQTVFQVGNIPPVCVVISVAIISDQCRLCRDSPCARPPPTLMTDVSSAPGLESPLSIN